MLRQAKRGLPVDQIVTEKETVLAVCLPHWLFWVTVLNSEQREQE